MQIIEYYDSDRQDHWLNQIKKSDWGAGQYLYELLSQNRFKEMTGSSSNVMMLVDGYHFVHMQKKTIFHQRHLLHRLDLYLLFRNTADIVTWEC